MTFGKLCQDIGMTDLERELAWAYIQVMRRLPERFWDPKKYRDLENRYQSKRRAIYPPRPLRKNFGRS